jgi:hypothetical protein
MEKYLFRIFWSLTKGGDMGFWQTFGIGVAAVVVADQVVIPVVKKVRKALSDDGTPAEKADRRAKAALRRAEHAREALEEAEELAEDLRRNAEKAVKKAEREAEKAEKIAKREKERKAAPAS